MSTQFNRDELEALVENGETDAERALARVLLEGMDVKPVWWIDSSVELPPEEWPGQYRNDVPNAYLCCVETAGGIPLYAAPPLAVVDEESESELKWRDLALQFDGHRMQALCFLKYILSQCPETEFTEAREFLKAGPIPGEEVLRQRLAEMVKKEAGNV